MVTFVFLSTFNPDSGYYTLAFCNLRFSTKGEKSTAIRYCKTASLSEKNKEEKLFFFCFFVYLLSHL